MSAAREQMPSLGLSSTALALLIIMCREVWLDQTAMLHCSIKMHLLAGSTLLLPRSLPLSCHNTTGLIPLCGSSILHLHVYLGLLAVSASLPSLTLPSLPLVPTNTI